MFLSTVIKIAHLFIYQKSIKKIVTVIIKQLPNKNNYENKTVNLSI